MRLYVASRFVDSRIQIKALLSKTPGTIQLSNRQKQGSALFNNREGAISPCAVCVGGNRLVIVVEEKLGKFPGSV
jgi:hypothetical protein